MSLHWHSYSILQTEFLLWRSGSMIDLVSVALPVQSLAQPSGLRIRRCFSSGVGHRCGLDSLPGLGTSVRSGCGQKRGRKTVHVNTSGSPWRRCWRAQTEPASCPQGCFVTTEQRGKIPPPNTCWQTPKSLGRA